MIIFDKGGPGCRIRSQSADAEAADDDVGP